MSDYLAPDEFWSVTPQERIAMCREMAAQAKRRAATSSGEEKDGYVRLAAEWERLAKELERWDQRGQGSAGTRRSGGR